MNTNIWRDMETDPAPSAAQDPMWTLNDQTIETGLVNDRYVWRSKSQEKISHLVLIVYEDHVQVDSILQTDQQVMDRLKELEGKDDGDCLLVTSVEVEGACRLRR